MSHITVTGRRSTAMHDLWAVALRAIRLAVREPEAIIPAVFIPMFFFVVNVGSLQKFVEGSGAAGNFKAFQLPVSIVFAVTGVSRASALVADINNGYFDRLLLTPVRRLSLLFGLMVADFLVVVALSVPVVVLGLVIGVHFQTGLLGALAFILLGGLWGVAFTGFPYAIALKTGNAAAVNSSFILFFPFAFLTTAYLPKNALTGWFGTVAAFNPMTYLLDGLRAILIRGWEAKAIGGAVLAIVGVGIVSIGMAFAALRGRVAHK